jgi:transposase
MVRASLLGLRRIERGRQTVLGNQQCHVCARAWLNRIHISADRRCETRALLARPADFQAMLAEREADDFELWEAEISS